jgi:spore germination protein GerM
MSRRMIVAVAMVLAALVLAAGCGGTGGSTAKPTTPTTPTTPATTPNPAGPTVSVFLLKGDVVSQVRREVATATVVDALNELLKGPTQAEKDQGYTTAIPAGTRLQAYKTIGATASADFSKELLNYGGGSAAVQAITSQIDNTVVSNNKAIKTVDITVDGKQASEVLQP